MVLPRTANMSNMITTETGEKMVYRRYASLYFIVGLPDGSNELLALEEIHLFVEVLDQYFGNVCELDIIFNFHRAYAVLFEVIMGGHIVEGSKKEAIEQITKQDVLIEEVNAANSGQRRDHSNEENGLSYTMQMQLGRRPTKQINHTLSF